MKKFLIGLLAATAFSGAACAQPAPATTQPVPAQAPALAVPAALPDADPAMWVVKDEDTTIYLFGTFHLLDGKTDWFNDEVKQAFDRSQELVFEIDMPSDQAEIAQQMQPLIVRYAVDPQGRSLKDLLSADQYAALYETLAPLGAPPGAFDQFEPWFAAMMLAAAGGQKLGLSGEMGAESVLKKAAEGRPMEIGAVETLEQQIRMFDSMPMEQQLNQLKETLDNIEELETVFPRMLAVWNAGDAKGLEDVMNEGLRDYPELRKVLLEDRNRAWAAWIDQRLDEPGTVFMAVGAGHLVGPDSVQVFLRQRDIDTQRVPNLTPAG